MMAPDLKRVYRPAGRIVVRRIGEDVLLVPVSGAAAECNRVYPINETGLELWEALSRGQTPEQAAARLEAVFAVDPERASQDSATFAAALVSEGLLQPIRGAGA